MLENDVGNEMLLEVYKDNHTIDSKKSPIYQFLEISYHWDLEYLFCGCLTTFSKKFNKHLQTITHGFGLFQKNSYFNNHLQTITHGFGIVT
jgi:hypothetical protein